MLQPSMVRQRTRLNRVTRGVHLVVVLLRGFNRTRTKRSKMRGVRAIFWMMSRSTILFIRATKIFRRDNHFTRNLKTKGLLRREINLLRTRLLPRNNQLTRLKFKTRNRNTNNRLKRPLLRPTRNTMLRKNRRNLFFRPNIGSNISSPIRSLFIPIRMKLRLGVCRPRILHNFRGLFRDKGLFTHRLQTFPFSRVRLTRIIRIRVQSITISTNLRINRMIINRRRVAISNSLGIALRTIHARHLYRARHNRHIFKNRVKHTTVNSSRETRNVSLLGERGLGGTVPLPVVRIFAGFIGSNISTNGMNRGKTGMQLLPSGQQGFGLSFDAFRRGGPGVNPFLSRLFLPGKRFL